MGEVNRRFGDAEIEIKGNELQYLLKIISNKTDPLPMEQVPEIKRLLVNTEKFMVHGNFMKSGIQISPCLTMDLH